LTGSLTAVVLAAGSGSRFSASGGTGHKLLASVGEVPVVVRAVDAAVAAGIGDVVVVTGAVDLEEVLADRSVRLVRNDRWWEGLAGSLHAGITAAAAIGAEAVVVGLGDQPAVPPDAWRTVAGHPGPQPLVVATYCGTRGNPVRIARDVWDRLPRSGDEGARALMRTRPDLVVEVACDGDPHDVDTVEDLDRWS
jgi:molybdenum cofactor cytidylyltransferase